MNAHMHRTHPLFDRQYYLANNPDVAQAGTDPLLHFMTYGVYEGRKPNPFFDPRYYLRRYPDVAAARDNPLVHYLTHGAAERRDPSQLFDTAWYLAQNPDVAASGINPLVHYLAHGQREGRSPSPRAEVPVQEPSSAASDTLSTVPRPLDSIAARPESWPASLAQPQIFYVSGLPDNTSHIYRVGHQVDALNAAGISCDWCSVYDIDRHQHRIIFSDAVVFFRVAWSDEVAQLAKKCRKAGVQILFDIDDYVFDPSIATERNVDGLRFLDRSDLPQYFEGVRRYQLMAANADEGIFTTVALAKAYRNLGKRAHIIRNGFSLNTLQASEEAYLEALVFKTGTSVCLGYASGSMTHQRDFSVVAPVVARVMAANPQVSLTTVGLLQLDEFPELQPFRHRIEQRGIVPHEQLPRELARFDVNLAPLEIGNPFCEAKSELKYYEAALVRVPTVASATEPFQFAIRQGVTGFTARTADDWHRALTALVHDANLRNRIAQAAYQHALDEYGPCAKTRRVTEVFSSVIAERQQRLRASPASFSQTITFVIPGMIKGSGGHNKIISLARALAARGYTLMLTFTEETEEYPSPDHVAGDLGVDDRHIRIVYSDRLVASSNITFATYWKTVYNIEKSECWPGRKFHFLQDYEPYFFPMSTDYLLAINAMQKDFKKISYGPWIKRIIKARHGLDAADIPFYIDKSIYRQLEHVRRRDNQILYFARPEMPRRCFDLGVEALRIYQQQYSDATEIVLFGSNAVGNISLPFRHVDMKVRRPDELALMYNEATVGLVFSPTNPSMVPFEMMACGLPVVDLDVEGNAENYGGYENAYLSNLDPREIAAHLHEAITIPEEREAKARNALEFASTLAIADVAIQRLSDIILAP